MRLSELTPEFIKYETRVETYSIIDGDPETWRERGCPSHEVTGPKEYTVFVDSIAEAQGIDFLCPKCFLENGGPVGTHMCEVTFEGKGVPDEQGSHNASGKPSRWGVSGTGIEDLTLWPSILLIGGCNWHGHITNGEVLT